MPFEVLATTPAGLLDPSIAIAASRAGAVGVLDLEHAACVDTATAAVATLARLGRGEMGVRLAADAPGIARAAMTALPAAVRTVVATSTALIEMGEDVPLSPGGPKGDRLTRPGSGI